MARFPSLVSQSLMSRFSGSGPGRILTGLVRRIERGLAQAALSDVSELSPAADFVYQNGG